VRKARNMDPETLIQPIFDLMPMIISIMMIGMVFGMLGSMFNGKRR
jgi:predicted branched-subunit amino acid permease